MSWVRVPSFTPFYLVGYRQVVRHQTLTLAFVGSNPAIPAIKNNNNADVAKLADALDLGSSAERRGGSTPFICTKNSFCGSGSVVERHLAKVNVASSNLVFRSTCGCSSMVEFQPSKLVVRVRFPSPAPFQPNNLRGVAQLGARVLWEHEVAGSIPVTPTINL